MGLILLKSILFIAHGSKKENTNEEIQQFIKELNDRFEPIRIELSYLEFTLPLIQEGIQNCVEKGSTKIIIMPLLLSEAVHVKEDIPREIQMAKIKYPNIEFRYGKPIGIHYKMYDILLTRLLETKCEIDQKTAVILVAKGSRFETANHDLRKIAEEFPDFCKAGMIEAAFLSMTNPKLTNVIEECIARGATKLIVLPYILFQGLLIKKIEETIDNFTIKFPHLTFLTGRYIGSHSLLFEIIKERIDEVLDKSTEARYE